MSLADGSVKVGVVVHDAGVVILVVGIVALGSLLPPRRLGWRGVQRMHGGIVAVLTKAPVMGHTVLLSITHSVLFVGDEICDESPDLVWVGSGSAFRLIRESLQRAMQQQGLFGRQINTTLAVLLRERANLFSRLGAVLHDDL